MIPSTTSGAIMKIYIISLARAPHRRNLMIRQCEALGLEYEIIEAVDGSLLDDVTKNKMVTPNKNYKNGEVGCAYSHILCYQKMVMDNTPHALILEDDAIIPSDITQITTLVANTPKVEILLLSYYSHRKGKPLELSSKNSHKLATSRYALMYPTDTMAVGSGMAYIISLDTARRIATQNTPMLATADHWGRFHELGCFETLCCLYPSPFEAAECNSTIDYDTNNSRLNQLAQTIRRYKLPLLLQLLQMRDHIKKRKKYQIVTVP
jgi:glycosyl transferase, family 25